MDIDKLSLTLFPDKFKAYITEDGEKVVQKSKTTEFEGRHCQKCGTFFKITEKEIEDCKNNGKDLPTICPRCTHGIYKTIVCCDCGKRFNFTERDRKFFEENEYDQPKRCPSCRAAKRRYNQGGRRDIRDNKGCFLNMLLFGLFLH